MPALIPAPATVIRSNGRTAEIASFGMHSEDPLLQSAVRAFVELQQGDDDLWQVTDGPISAQTFPVRIIHSAVDVVALAAGLNPIGGEPDDERYTFEVAADGIEIRGATPVSIFRALTSLRQLVDEEATSAADAPLTLPQIVIHDGPRFAWRGLSLDVVRRFYTVDEVKTVLDLLAYYKLNVLHLHLTDDEGWRLEIPAWPRLTTVGAQGAVGERPGGYYSTEEYTSLIEYATARHITIVPEIDLPGHSRAALKAYPELRNCAILPPEFADANDLDFVALDSADQVTGRFIADVIAEVARVTPGAYLHIGGDEPWGMPDEAYRRFVRDARATIHEHGKRMIGWQEIARTELDATDIVQAWIAFDVDEVVGEGFSRLREMSSEQVEFFSSGYRNSDADVPAALAAGSRLLLSPTGLAYLDNPYAEPSADPVQEADRKRLGMVAYTPATVAEAFDWDPATQLAGANTEKDIVGVEAAMWSESIEQLSDLQFLLLPRLPGLAEKGWAAPSIWEDYSERLAFHGRAWERNGWTYFRSSLVDWR